MRKIDPALLAEWRAGAQARHDTEIPVRSINELEPTLHEIDRFLVWLRKAKSTKRWNAREQIRAAQLQISLAEINRFMNRYEREYYDFLANTPGRHLTSD